ncbi:ABC-type nickel/cobalt efflux system permease component RcnA [Arthrobacter sp. UYEF21]
MATEAGLDQIGGAPENAQDALAGGHGATPQDPDNTHDAGGDEAHHVQGCLGQRHAAVEKAEPRSHEQHHCRRDHQPDMLRSDLNLRVPSDSA